MERTQNKLSLSDCLGIEKSCVALNLRRAERIVSQIYDNALRPVGIKGTQFSLLVTIRAMQPATLSRIADHIDMDRTTLTRNLAPLVKAGWVVVVTGEDARTRLVALTAAGQAKAATAHAVWQRAQDQIGAALSPALTTALHGMIDDAMTRLRPFVANN